MTDIATISTFLSSIRTATEIAKAIKSADVSLEKAETKLKMAELIESLADAKMQAAEIQEVIQEKDNKIAELEKAMKIKDSLSFENNYYWVIKGEEKEGPYCTHCWDKESRL